MGCRLVFNRGLSRNVFEALGNASKSSLSRAAPRPVNFSHVFAEKVEQEDRQGCSCRALTVLGC